MRLKIWRYELRRIGWQALFGPPLALGAVGFFALLAAVGSTASQVDRILSASLDVLPVVAGLGAASAAGGDGALELQLSLPTSFRATVLRRLALAVGWTVLIALASTLALYATHRLVWPVSVGADQLIWLAPLVWMTGVGVAAALGLRGVAVGSGLVGFIWVLEQLFSDFFIGTSWRRSIWMFLRYSEAQSGAWYWNRLCLILFALALFVLAFRLLGKTERLLKGEA